MNHLIALADAAAMTARHRQHRETVLKTEYQGQNILPLSEGFDRAPFDAVLAQPGCAGLRIYYGMDTGLNVHAIIVGVNAAGEDMVASGTATTTAALTEEEDLIIEVGNRCPDLCAPDSALNT